MPTPSLTDDPWPISVDPVMPVSNNEDKSKVRENEATVWNKSVMSSKCGCRCYGDFELAKE